VCPLSDDALLDWALFPSEADPDLLRHLRDCRSCGDRSRVVLREQDLLRGAFERPVLPAESSPSLLWPRLGIAALLLLGVGVGTMMARIDHAPLRPSPLSRHHHAPMAPIQSDLDVMAQKIAAARDTLGNVEDQTATNAYLDLLIQEEELYIDGMQQFLSERSPLSSDHEESLRRMIHAFYAQISSQEKLVQASRGFRDQVKSLLNEEQYLAFEEFSRQGMEWQWKTAIALLVDDLSLELDLRFSEGERVRRALESKYPRVDLPVLCSDHCPPDPLVVDPILSGAVRNSLDAAYHRKFESYLGHVTVARDRALKITRQRRSLD
jgi:hypothetical protein